MFRKDLILIVEDEPIIALGLAAAVEAQNGRVAGPVGTVAEALAVVAAKSVAAAVVDANLADRDVTPLALLLIERGIPFIVYTGTGLPEELAELHPSLPVVMKPFPIDRVVTLLGDRLHETRAQAG